MPESSPSRVELWLVRHGETAWSRDRRHTGLSDIPLTDHGREQAAALRPLLAAQTWDAVLCSPLSRARETAALALPDATPVFDDDLVERDYGPTEGITSAELRRSDPTWDSWTTVVAGAETIEQVGDRTDRVIARVTGANDSAEGRADGAQGAASAAGPALDRRSALAADTPASSDIDAGPARRVLIVAHGHLLRILAARWIGEPAGFGARLALDVASASVLGHEHDRRVITRWNVLD